MALRRCFLLKSRLTFSHAGETDGRNTAQDVFDFRLGVRIYDVPRYEASERTNTQLVSTNSASWWRHPPRQGEKVSHELS